jgi:hypothetical protein
MIDQIPARSPFNLHMQAVARVGSRSETQTTAQALLAALPLEASAEILSCVADLNNSFLGCPSTSCFLTRSALNIGNERARLSADAGSL